jgi:hypothetical protein
VDRKILITNLRVVAVEEILAFPVSQFVKKQKRALFFKKGKTNRLYHACFATCHVVFALFFLFFSSSSFFFFFLFPCFLVFVGRRTVSNLVGTSCSSSIESKKPIFLLFLFFVCGSLTGIEPIATCLQLLCVLVQAVESVFSCFSCFQLFLFPTFLVFFFF